MINSSQKMIRSLKRRSRGWYLAVFLLLVSVPARLSADDHQGIQRDQLVPCDGPDCDFDALVKLAENVLDFLIFLAVLIAAGLFVWAGFLYLTAGGSQDKVKQAHGVFWKVAIGLVIVLAAWLIVNLILSVLTDRGGIEDWRSQAEFDERSSTQLLT